MCVTPIAFSSLATQGFQQVISKLATTIVGIESEKTKTPEPKRATFPLTAPAAIVDIDRRRRPGTPAEKYLARPNPRTRLPQTHVLPYAKCECAFSGSPQPPLFPMWPFSSSTDPHNDSARSAAKLPMMYKLSKCFPITLVSKKAGIAVTTKATRTRAQRMRKECAVAAIAFRKSSQELRDPFTKINRQAKNRANWNHDRIHLPVGRSSGLRGKGLRKSADCAVELTGKNSVSPFNDS